jgi:micrococcal nuclease
MMASSHGRPMLSIGAGLRSGLRVLLLSAALAASTAAQAVRGHGRIAYVFDADTFRLDTGTRLRIAAIDAAETRADRAKCARELSIGKTQTERARALLDGRRVGYQVVGRNRDRLVAKVWLGRRDLGALLVRMGAARPWPRGAPKPDLCR